MKVKEGKERKAVSVWLVYSANGVQGVIVIRYADGGMEVIHRSGSVSRGKVAAKDAKAWARGIAAEYFQRNDIERAREKLEEALAGYKEASTPLHKVELAP